MTFDDSFQSIDARSAQESDKVESLLIKLNSGLSFLDLILLSAKN